jgi:hypothetical protein
MEMPPSFLECPHLFEILEPPLNLLIKIGIVYSKHDGKITKFNYM